MCKYEYYLDEDIIEVKEIVIKELPDDELNSNFGLHKYSYFRVYNNIKHEQIDYYDVINIVGKVRFDIQDGYTRFFPIFGNTTLYYDLGRHSILGFDPRKKEE